MYKPCEPCDGTGKFGGRGSWYDHPSGKPCSDCDGKGHIQVPDYVVTQDSYLTSLISGEPRLMAAQGDLVYEFHGATYGCVSPAGVACSKTGRYDGPFFEVPRENLRANEL